MVVNSCTSYPAFDWNAIFYNCVIGATKEVVILQTNVVRAEAAQDNLTRLRR